MSIKTGSLTINSENLLPIIKKWLYSDHDIFVREVISNGCDAITKLHKLSMMGEYEYPDTFKDSIQVVVDPDARTLSFTDTGLGMTEEEVEQYITQIAFSGASAFIEQYKDKVDKDEIIGHFGLGFFSVYMVAENVEIDTLSYRPAAVPVHWESDGETEYTIGEGSRTEVGTTITLHLNEDALEFANEYRVREILEKYCSFMPVEIFLSKAGAAQEYETIDENDLREDDVIVERIHTDEKTEEREVRHEDGTTGPEKETVVVSPARDEVKINKRPVSVNDIHPLWNKRPAECTAEEYKAFYRKVFNDYREPLFWIHLNMDYPFNLKGILYFPKINTEYDSIEGTIKLYNNQVFIADNIKEVIPEYLMLLKGVIDCPDLPLNVSRSALQNDGTVRKISEYITKKVADKLSGMCKTDREAYESYWDDISPFIKYGCIRDSKFSERMMDYILFKDIQGNYTTLNEFAPKTEPTDAAGDDTVETAETTASAAEEKKKETIYYVTDEVQQSQYINMFRENELNAVILKHNIDSAFITHVEQARDDLKFQRIDAEVSSAVTEETSEQDAEALKADSETLTELFRKALDNDKLTVKVEKLKNAAISSMMTLSEESRRMQEMMKMYGMAGMDASMFPAETTLILNANNDLVKYLLKNGEVENSSLFCRQLYDLALMANQQLSPDQMTAFIARSNEILLLLTK